MVSYKADVLNKNANKIDFVSPSADCNRSVVLQQLLDSILQNKVSVFISTFKIS